MAEIFQEVFGSKLVKDNLVEQYDLDRLPSPYELQGKIILKGTEKNKKKKTLVRLIVCILLECLSPISSIEITASYSTSKTTYRNSFQSSFTKVRIRAKKGMHFSIDKWLILCNNSALRIGRQCWKCISVSIKIWTCSGRCKQIAVHITNDGVPCILV